MGQRSQVTRQFVYHYKIMIMTDAAKVFGPKVTLNLTSQRNSTLLLDNRGAGRSMEFESSTILFAWSNELVNQFRQIMITDIADWIQTSAFLSSTHLLSWEYVVWTVSWRICHSERVSDISTPTVFSILRRKQQLFQILEILIQRPNESIKSFTICFSRLA